MSPCFKALWEHHRFTGAWIYLSRPTINVYPTLVRATQQLSYVSLMLASIVSLAPPDPPWSNSLLWGSWVVRRILVHRVIVSLISVPCRARGSAVAVRRIFVISPESSHHQRRAVLMFARVQMCGHLPLVRSIKCPCREIGGIYGHPLSKPISFLP